MYFVLKGDPAMPSYLLRYSTFGNRAEGVNFPPVTTITVAAMTALHPPDSIRKSSISQLLDGIGCSSFGIN